MTRHYLGAALLLPALVGAGLPAQARDKVQIVGSSTVYPFAAAVAERVSLQNGGKFPVIESTGTGGGIKLFCAGAGDATPDVTNASRPMKPAELEECRANGVTPVEIRFGFDGIVLAGAASGEDMDLSLEQLFLGLARKVPVEGRLLDNPFQSWRQISAELPDKRIEILGPPPTSGTRDTFVEIAMEQGCSALADAGSLGLKGATCHELRQDGAFLETGENDDLVVAMLEQNPRALGIFGYSFLDQNRGGLKAVKISGVEPSAVTIAAGTYPLSRPLYFYVKEEHLGKIPGLEEYLLEFASERALGPGGYLAGKGLIPLPKHQRLENEKLAEELAAAH
ncbi:MAG: phosphate ABC transporter substrate-binding protein [Polymorphum sp.]|uniref:Phosphate ABC transporter substrate-binding protein n=1 Tax=Pannonibacter phragmitetus TaxID=121719 RepID=A0A0U3P1N4_9HYPH|nr:substrate-binding domain-containing protein [Pannonibacter phragmitetus]ALV25749.1 phosphate ABC transporter substrate-binding protein [Pannonibacter phragmitetus]MBA4205386.1 phosphate ABC transporter substrate-binding protein [Polymorphum sp.]